MKNPTRCPLTCHLHSGSALFDGHSRPDLNGVPLAVRKLVLLRGMSIPTATIVARLAGLGGPEVL